MPTVDYFCYAVRSEFFEAQAAAAGWELDFNSARYWAKDLIMEAGLGGKAKLHHVWNDIGRFTCIVLAASKYDPYAPNMPIGKEPPLEEYESLRTLLGTQKEPQWRKFKL